MDKYGQDLLTHLYTFDMSVNQSINYLLLKTRLKKVVLENFPSVNNFSTQALIPHATIHRWLDLKDNNPPGLDIVLKLAELLPSLNLRWLLQPDNQSENFNADSSQINSPDVKTANSLTTKDSMIELQQKHIVMLERETDAFL